MAAGEPAVRSLPETADLLAEPFALEDIGSQAVPLVITPIDPREAAAMAAEDRDRMHEVLSSVRAVSVAVLDAVPDRRVADIAEGFDIVLGPTGGGTGVVDIGGSDEMMTSLIDAVRRHPQAAVALVELLRIGAFERVPQGLVLESLTFSTLQCGSAFAAWLEARGPLSMPPDLHPVLLVERRETSLHLTLNRAERANAFSAALRDALVEALRTAAADPTIEGVVIDGAGTSFCSGGDLAEFGTSPDPATGHETRVMRSPGWWVHHLARDVRVHLHGHCVGAGIEIPAFAGTVIAAPDTTIRLPEVAMGLVPGSGGTVSIPRRIGRQRAAYLAITGAAVDARQALAWGLVDRISE